MTGVYIRVRFGYRDTGEKAMGRQRLRFEWCIYNPKNNKDCHHPPEARRGRERFFSRTFGGSMTADTLISDFQSPEL